MNSSPSDSGIPTDKQTGVYVIKNLCDGKVYVGSTSQGFRKRWHEHRRHLRKGTHGSAHLQHAWNRDGEASFEFAVLEVVTDLETLLAVEAKWFDETGCCDGRYGYNVRTEPHSNRGIKLGPQSPELRARRSAWMKGRVVSEETRAKLRARPPRRGHTISEAHKQALLRASKGVPRHAYSAEFRAKQSAIQTGRKLPPRSPEHCARISEALRKRGATRNRPALTGAQAREICEAYAAGGVTHKVLAETYGVSGGTIAHCLRNGAARKSGDSAQLQLEMELAEGGYHAPGFFT